MADINLNQRLSKLSKNFKTFTETKYMPTGSLIMDTVMGGGLPVGKMIELASDAGAGKTTITLSMCLDLLKQGKKIIYLDHEGAITTSQLEGTGVAPYLYNEDNPEGQFYLFQVMTYSDSEDILNMLLGTDEFALVVVDSVTAMINDEYLREVEDPNTKDKTRSVTDVMPGEDARLLGKFLKKFKAVCTKHSVTMILINQLRTNLNITGGMSTKISTGGAAVEFYPDIRLRLERPQAIYQKRMNNLTGEVEEQQVGCTATIYAYKNKMTAGKIKVPITIVYGRGISNLLSYKLWLPNKMTMFEGQEVPMLVTKGGGYNMLTINGVQYSARGDDALTDTIKLHFDEIRSCFSASDFKITENKAYAEFDESGNRIVEEEVGEEYSVPDDSNYVSLSEEGMEAPEED